MASSGTREETTDPPVVQMRGIVKRFPGVLANDQVNFEVCAGEVHTLLGENGAGKSTLVSILGGLYSADEGEILIRGRPVHLSSPRDAIVEGIGVVYQNFMLVEMHTVAENMILGMPTPRLSLNWTKVEREIAEFGKRYGMPVNPRARIYQLSVGEQQRVEILKALYRGADILILDEPTAVLAPQEVEEFFNTLRAMAAQGKTVILISHKLEEVMAISDRITVMRGGRVVTTVRPCETTPQELARMMVGRDVIFRTEKQAVEIGDVVLSVCDLCSENDKGLPALKNVSFSIRAGEVLGVAGVAGNGQRELAEVITGLRKARSGRFQMCSCDLTNCHPGRIIQERVSHVPEDRAGVGLVTTLPITDNVILKEYRSPPLSRGLFLSLSAIRDFAGRLVSQFDIATPSIHTPAGSLSGGNLQKAVLAREIHTEPRLMVAVHPTRGLDVGATETVRRVLLAQRTKGMGLLLISEDLDEVLQLSDRVLVLYEGEVQGIMDAERADIEEIGMMMTGARRKSPKAQGVVSA